MEEHKAELRPSDPEVDEISDRVDELIERMSAKSAAEREIAHEIGRQDDQGQRRDNPG